MLIRRSLLPAAAAALAGLVLCVPAAQARTVSLLPITETPVATARPPSGFTALEGNTVAGGYWYAAELRNTYRGTGKGKTFYSSVVLVKMHLNGTRVAVSKPYVYGRNLQSNLLGHANSITYNSRTNQLVVPAANNDNTTQFTDQSRTVNIVNPTTLARTTKRLDYPITALCFDATRNTYLGRARSDHYQRTDYYTYDVHLNAGKKVFSVPDSATAGTSQSTDCDKSYVYILRSTVGAAKVNRVYVYDWAGRPVINYQDKSSNQEGEQLSHAGGNVYLGVNVKPGKLTRLNDFQYTVHYAAGRGGHGSMASTVVLYGHNTRLAANTFTHGRDTFTGWTAYRDVDHKYAYADPAHPSRTGWYAAGHQPRGWTLGHYGNRATVAHTAARGNVTLTATWRAAA